MCMFYFFGALEKCDVTTAALFRGMNNFGHLIICMWCVHVPVQLTIEQFLSFTTAWFIFQSKRLNWSPYTVCVFEGTLGPTVDCPGCHVTAGVLFVSCGPLLTKTALLWEASCGDSLWHMQTYAQTLVSCGLFLGCCLTKPQQGSPALHRIEKYILKYDISIRLAGCYWLAEVIIFPLFLSPCPQCFWSFM